MKIRKYTKYYLVGFSVMLTGGGSVILLGAADMIPFGMLLFVSGLYFALASVFVGAATGR